MKFHLRNIAVLTTIATLSLCAVVVYASDAGRDSRHDEISAQQSDNEANPNEDVISARDHSAWRQDNIEGRFGVRFHSHSAVCSDASAGNMHCSARVTTDAKGTPQAASLPSGLGPVQFHAAYTTATSTNTRKVIAVVDAYNDPNITTDLATYSTTYGIPQLPACATGKTATSSPTPCFQKVNQNGGTTYPATDAGWSLEIALDVESAHAMCQNCSIILVEASSASYANLMAAVDRAVALGANVVSNSYGSSEFSGQTAYDSHFNVPGVAFTVSAGDSGYAAEYPASSRYVTAVGGTSLYFTSGVYNRETVWSGTGSGCSAYSTKPSWQSSLITSCTKRIVGDVSAVADPNTGAAVYSTVKYGNKTGWFQVGGTSLSAPLIAGVYALSGNTSGSANQIPYTLGSGSNLHDITVGSNGSCGSSPLCTAAVGFDGPTGLGTPKGLGAF
ncbi:MAG: hypothetical protein RLZZ347_423 [Candidatus Parcubacteria bacterium]|jgi:subtilase family serine protease